MNETFKHVAIFAVFLLCVLFLSQVEGQIRDFFNFKLGKAALLAVWATAVVVIFQLVNYYLASRSSAVIYGIAAGMLSLLGLLTKLDVVKF